MYVLTGAAGFIGANVIDAMNQAGIHNIIAVDNLTNGDKFKNLADLSIADYYDKQDFRKRLANGEFKGKIKGILHYGACSTTTENNGLYMMDNNYRYSVELVNFCQKENIPFIYASSAAVYGISEEFSETSENEAPLNIYGYSKLLFDHYVRSILDSPGKQTAQIVGLRYFNVYGAREWHKGAMASVAYHFYHQYIKEGNVRLFSCTEGVLNGEQLRDFVYVGDVVNVNLHFLTKQTEVSGIFNLGTGKSASYNDMAVSVINSVRRLQHQVEMTLSELRENGKILYIPFPDYLVGKYQNYTKADLAELRMKGRYSLPFLSVKEAVPLYIEKLFNAMK